MDNRGRKGIFASTVKNTALKEGSDGKASNMLRGGNIFAVILRINVLFASGRGNVQKATLS
jgi:hypothetical protein